MKHKILILLFALTTGTLRAQTIKWASLRDTDRQILHANVGAEYGVVYGLGYGYKVTDGRFPIVANVEYSFPSGDRLLDDFKTRFGGQARLLKVSDFQLSAKAQGIFRRYQNEMVRLLNWGADLTGTVGYYRPRWFVAGEFGFDKAIATNFKHSAKYRDEFPDVKDGWYEPATGGNFHYGLQTGISFGIRHDLTLKGGLAVAENFKTKPLLPFYAQLGYNYRLGKWSGR